MDDFNKLYDEMAKEYPELANILDFVMGDNCGDRLLWEYERGYGVKHLIDEAKEKYLIILQDFGLFQSD